jgi:hypothetical protein
LNNVNDAMGHAAVLEFFDRTLAGSAETGSL